MGSRPHLRQGIATDTASRTPSRIHNGITQLKTFIFKNCKGTIIGFFVIISYLLSFDQFNEMNILILVDIRRGARVSGRGGEARARGLGLKIGKFKYCFLVSFFSYQGS